MRSSSQVALANLRTHWEDALGHVPGSLVALSRSLFEAADFLSDERAVRRGFTDPARSGEHRIALVRALFEGKVEPQVLTVLEGVARAKWSNEADVVEALEELGAQGILINAERARRLDTVEGELYRCARLLARHRELRTVLADRTYPLESRRALVRKVFAHCGSETLELVSRAVEKAPNPAITASLFRYVDRAAERSHHLVAAVRSASELSPAQRERLTTILSQRYGKPVSVHVSLDPSLLGGMRIRVGEDVIDASLAARMSKARELLTT